jgi:hypothetical protein
VLLLQLLWLRLVLEVKQPGAAQIAAAAAVQLAVA